MTIEEIYTKEIIRFGLNIRQLRQERGYKRQEDFAAVSQLDRTQISRIERGMFNIELETIVKLANGLKSPIANIVEYEKNTNSKLIKKLLNPANEKVKLGKRLAQVREFLGLTQLDLEISTGIGRSAISDYENGLKNVEFRTLVKLMTALNVSMYTLFDYSGELS